MAKKRRGPRRGPNVHRMLRMSNIRGTTATIAEIFLETFLSAGVRHLALQGEPEGTLPPASALSGMTHQYSTTHSRPLTSEERKARDAARRADAEQAMREYEAAQRAFHANRERLKAERLAREARAAGK